MKRVCLSSCWLVAWSVRLTVMQGTATVVVEPAYLPRSPSTATCASTRDETAALAEQVARDRSEAEAEVEAGAGRAGTGVCDAPRGAPRADPLLVYLLNNGHR